ncbi:MAG TPA: hypothetical protein VMS88_03665 [Terriglobales bacterium]|nr:hypothetical protein [Terriglobales bacterium]
MVPLVLRSLGAPLGEPVADDFDFLHRALLEGRHTFLDGGGSAAFWRPLSHQGYYDLLGPLLLRAPGVVAAIHAALLALGALLIYRALRLRWSGPCAAAAASFPLLAESTRVLLAWPAESVDLGLFFCSALALHEASRRRLATTLGALLAALFCKEVAVVTALLLPWLPGVRSRRERLRWVAATGALVLAWGAAYAAIRHHVGLALPHGMESAPHASLVARFHWAALNSVRAIFDLALHPGPLDLPAALAVGAIGLVAALAFVASRRARGRLASRLPWVAWGALWFALASATMVTVHPFWAPDRSQFGSVGLGIALVALLDAAHPGLIAALVAARLVLLGLSPGPPPIVTEEVADRGAWLDFERLVRLQRLMRATREALHREHPALPANSGVVVHYVPLSSVYAYGGSRALQTWYRDTTLRMGALDGALCSPIARPAAVLEFEPDARPQVMLLDPAAVEHVRLALEGIGRGEWTRVLTELAIADSLHVSRTERVFRAMIAQKRAAVLLFLGREAEAEREALRSVALWPRCDEGRFTLAALWKHRGRLDEAEAQLDTLLRFHPDHAAGAELLAELRDERRVRIR